MKFIYHPQAGNSSVIVDGELFKHIFKSRRKSSKEKLILQNLKDNYSYIYNVESIDKKQAVLNLKDKKILQTSKIPKIHIYWCVIDTKDIEKALPLLNEFGIHKITFIYSDRSQKQYKINQQRVNKILIQSSQQCGRNSIIQVDIKNSIDEIINNDFVVINFSHKFLKNEDNIKAVLIGPEGGFSTREIKLLENKKCFGFNTPHILKSQSAVIGAAAQILL